MSTPLHLFTWNVGNLDKDKSVNNLKIALEYLRRWPQCVASFQEVPEDTDLSIVGQVSNKELLLLGEITIPKIKKKLILVGSSKFVATKLALTMVTGIETESEDRILAVSIQNSTRGQGGWEPITVLAIHSRSKAFCRDGQRTEHAYRIRQHIDNLFHMNNRLVFMGDFNANPYDPEILSKRYFNAVRNYETLTYKARKMTILYNPMWDFLKDTLNGSTPNGTYFYSPSQETDELASWHLIDQILVSKTVYNPLNRAEILQKLSLSPNTDHVLIDGEKKPDRTNYSDHLPVHLELGV